MGIQGELGIELMHKSPPMALTPPTSRRPRHYWRTWGDNTGEHNMPWILFAQLCFSVS